MKAKTFTGLTLFFVLTLTFSGVVTAKWSQPGPVEKRGSPSPFAMPEVSLQQMTDSQAQYVSLVGQIGGDTRAMAVKGDYAYVGIGPRLVILNIIDPFLPTLAGQTAVLPGIVEDVVVVGNYAYVADGGAGLRIFDVSLPRLARALGATTGT